MLRVTRLTDYATVVLTVLASRPTDAMLSATELADLAGLEPPTVSKLLKALAHADLVAGFRGTRGGYRLARAAEDISLFEIVEAMEGPLAITECSRQDHSQCSIFHGCGIRAGWRRINDVIGDALRAVSLADMAQEHLFIPLPPPRRIAAEVRFT